MNKLTPNCRNTPWKAKVTTAQNCVLYTIKYYLIRSLLLSINAKAGFTVIGGSGADF